MTPYRIPLTSSQQQLGISLGGTVYTLTLSFNSNANSWTLDIADQSGNNIVTGIALVTGCDLLGQYGYLNFGGSLVAMTDYDTDAVPTYSNLGDNGNLYFITVP